MPPKPPLDRALGVHFDPWQAIPLSECGNTHHIVGFSYNRVGYACRQVRHENCEQARRLLDGYLMVLSIVDSRWLAEKSAAEPELEDANDRLKAARGKYWTHVQQHGCRKS